MYDARIGSINNYGFWGYTSHFYIPCAVIYRVRLLYKEKMPPHRLVAVFVLAQLCCTIIANRDADEEAAMVRMLSLHHRALFSDRPLPVASESEASDTAKPQACASSSDSEGYPTSTSAWAGRLAASEHAEHIPFDKGAAVVDSLFLQTVRSLREGSFGEARAQLHGTCVGVQTLGEGGHPMGDLLMAWVQQCALLLQYVPSSAPVREDHKRLLMLLHDLGGDLMLAHLAGSLASPLLTVDTMAELGTAVYDFGESNRKIALSRALGLGVASASGARKGAALLRKHQLCSSASGASGATPEADEPPDAWSAVGWRACATLLLRGNRVGEALQVLRTEVTAAPTMHAFISAFEMASRLPPSPPPPPPRVDGPAPTRPPPPPSLQRFSSEHMLEVLEAALGAPQHGLASEGNLLRWELRRHLRWGQAAPPPAAPLACPPVAAQPLLRAPRLLVAMPFVAGERSRLADNLGSWRDGGGLEPCATAGGGGGDGHGSVDLMLYAAGRASDADLSWLRGEPTRLLGVGASRCFGRVVVRHANLSAAEQFYIGGWDNTGPNNLFYRLFFDEALHSTYDMLMWMEADVVPIAPGWARRLLEESVSPRGFWRKGPAQQPRLVHAMVSTHHYHMNSAGLYRLGQPCFVELMRRVRAAYPLAPHDVSTHLFLHDPRHFHLWQTVAHRFLYTDVVQNRLDEWALDDVRALSAETVLVHGKHRRR